MRSNKKRSITMTLIDSMNKREIKLDNKERNNKPESVIINNGQTTNSLYGGGIVTSLLLLLSWLPMPGKSRSASHGPASDDPASDDPGQGEERP